MKVRLLRDSRINHKAGEIVEVSPAEFQFLTSIKSAEAYREVEVAVNPPKAETADATPTKSVSRKKTK